MASGDYQVQTGGMDTTLNDVRGLIEHAFSVTSQLGGMSLNAQAFGLFGSEVGSANTQLHTQLGTGLTNMTDLLNKINGNARDAWTGYIRADDDVATGFGGSGYPESNPFLNHGLEQNFPAAPFDLAQDPTLRDQIGWAEGNKQHVYIDSKGHPSVGIGVNLDRGSARSALAAVGADYTAVRNGTADLTTDQVNQLFARDTNVALRDARSYYSGFDNLDTVRQRVITDMSFNMGGATLNKFVGVRAALERGDFNAAADHMEQSAWFQQVGRRGPPLVEEMRTGVPVQRQP